MRKSSCSTEVEHCCRSNFMYYHYKKPPFPINRFTFKVSNIFTDKQLVSKALQELFHSFAELPKELYLTCPENNTIVELRSFFLLGIFNLLPPDADCYRSKILIYSKVVLMLFCTRVNEDKRE